MGLDPEDVYTCFCLDQVVWSFGTTVEGKIQEASKSRGKNDTEAQQNWRADAALRKCLGLQPKFASAPAPTM